MTHDDTHSTNKDNRNENENQVDIQKLGEAIEDLIYMEAITLRSANNKNSNYSVTLSAPFALILSNIISSMNLRRENEGDVMKSMYFSLLIYMNEQLKMPKSLTMAFGNDLETLHDRMGCNELISNYVKVLFNIFSSTNQRMRRGLT